MHPGIIRFRYIKKAVALNTITDKCRHPRRDAPAADQSGLVNIYQKRPIAPPPCRARTNHVRRTNLEIPFPSWMKAAVYRALEKSCFYQVISPKTRSDGIIRWGGFYCQKTLGKFWYTGACYEPGCTLFPPSPRILEVIIRKNAEPGRNYSTMPDGNG